MNVSAIAQNTYASQLQSASNISSKNSSNNVSRSTIDTSSSSRDSVTFSDMALNLSQNSNNNENREVRENDGDSDDMQKQASPRNNMSALRKNALAAYGISG